MGDENMADAAGVDAQPAHFFFQTVVVIARVDHQRGVALAVKEDIRHPLPHAGDVLVYPAGVQGLEDLLAAVHLAHFFFLKFRCLFGHDLSSLLCCDAKPSSGVLMNLELTKPAFFQQGFQLPGPINFHAADPFFPLLPLIVAAAFVADQERAAGR